MNKKPEKVFEMKAEEIDFVLHVHARNVFLDYMIRLLWQVHCRGTPDPVQAMKELRRDVLSGFKVKPDGAGCGQHNQTCKIAEDWFSKAIAELSECVAADQSASNIVKLHLVDIPGEKHTDITSKKSH